MFQGKAPFQTYTPCWLKEMVTFCKKQMFVSFLFLCCFLASFIGFLRCYPVEARKSVWRKTKQNRATLGRQGNGNHYQSTGKAIRKE